MKPILLLPLLSALLFSCSKDEKMPEKANKIILVSRSTTTTGSNSSSTRFNRNADGRLLSYVGPGSTDSVAIAYNSNGKIESLRFTALGQNRSEYAYDDQGRLALAQGYYNDGSKGAVSTFTYFDDRIEELLVYPGNLTNKKIYTYTADKKNIAGMKWIGTSGNIAEEETYTYTTVKAAKYGYEEIRVNNSEHSLATTVRTSYTNGVAGTPITFSRKVIANAEGYPASIENSASNSTTVSTTTYEYFTR